jgi:transposase
MMYVCILDAAGAVLVHKNIPTDSERFLKLVAPYREDLVVAVESMFCWYWLADLCYREKIHFVLGHALYMKAIHGAKSKNDKIDSEKIAMLIRGGMLPLAYPYPAEHRGTRDMIRRRHFYVQRRAELISHVKMTYQQYNFKDPLSNLSRKCNREALQLPFADESVVRMVRHDLEMIDQYSDSIAKLESHFRAKRYEAGAFGHKISLLRSVPGIGETLSVAILYEVGDIRRFPTVQNFISYCRLVKPKKTSAGKPAGKGGSKIGNHHLKWAFTEAVLIHLRDDAKGKAYMEKLMKKHPKGKAMAIMAAKIARAVYFILQREKPFSEEKFYQMAA